MVPCVSVEEDDVHIKGIGLARLAKLTFRFYTALQLLPRNAGQTYIFQPTGRAQLYLLWGTKQAFGNKKVPTRTNAYRDF